MNKKFLISWVVIFIVWMAGSFVVHGVLLDADYSGLPNLMRSEAEAQSYFHWMVLAHILMAGAFVWIYARGNEDKPWVGSSREFDMALPSLCSMQFQPT